MQNQAAAIKLRAERKLGKMFKDIQRMPGERTDLDSTSMHDAMGLIQPLTYTEILENNQIEPTAAYRWQLEAEVPEEKVDEMQNLLNSLKNGSLQSIYSLFMPVSRCLIPLLLVTK